MALSPMNHDGGERVKDGVPSNSPRAIRPQGRLAFRWARATSTPPRFFKARRILIGSIAVPSYSPGTGNDVTISTRMAGKSFSVERIGSAIAQTYRRVTAFGNPKLFDSRRTLRRLGAYRGRMVHAPGKFPSPCQLAPPAQERPVTRRTPFALGVVILAASALLPGCSSPPAVSVPVEEDQAALTERNPALLDSVVILIRDAATNEGGENFNVAVENLNAYFRDSKPEDFALPAPTLAFLRSQLTPDAIELIGQRGFAQRDGRHIEDSLLYHAVATRVAGQGDDLTRVRRLFDWVVRHAMLVPPGSLAPAAEIEQAQARPYDVMLRGMGTEDGRGWSERGWLFMALCRQIGLDSGLIVYSPTRAPPGRCRRAGTSDPWPSPA